MGILQWALQIGPPAPPAQPVTLDQVALVGFGLLMAVVSAIMFKKWYKGKEAKDKAKEPEPEKI